MHKSLNVCANFPIHACTFFIVSVEEGKSTKLLSLFLTWCLTLSHDFFFPSILHVYRRCDNRLQQTHGYSNKVHSQSQTSRPSPETAAAARDVVVANRQRGGKNCVIM